MLPVLFSRGFTYLIFRFSNEIHDFFLCVLIQYVVLRRAPKHPVHHYCNTLKPALRLHGLQAVIKGK